MALCMKEALLGRDGAVTGLLPASGTLSVLLSNHSDSCHTHTHTRAGRAPVSREQRILHDTIHKHSPFHFFMPACPSHRVSGKLIHNGDAKWRSTVIAAGRPYLRKSPQITALRRQIQNNSWQKAANRTTGINCYFGCLRANKHSSPRPCPDLHVPLYHFSVEWETCRLEDKAVTSVNTRRCDYNDCLATGILNRKASRF